MSVKQGLVMVVATLGVTAIGVMTQPAPQSVQAAKVKRSMKTFPKAIRGTWYNYDTYEHKVDRIKITAKKIIYNKSTENLRVRTNNNALKPQVKVKHPSWIVAYGFKIKKQKWVNTRGWYQSAGDGDYYHRTTHKIHGKKHTMLQMAGGATVATYGYGYRTKKLAKANAKRWFKGDRHENF